MRKRNRNDDLAIEQIGNLRTIIAGSVDPDIKAIAERKRQQPERLLALRFARKPGLIAQLASKIMELSGFDDEDIRSALAAKN